MIYCAEDIDNAWEDNHFKDVLIKHDSSVVEERRVFEATGEEYIVLKSKAWKISMKNWESKPTGVYPGSLKVHQSIQDEYDITFVPYYFELTEVETGICMLAWVEAEPV